MKVTGNNGEITVRIKVQNKGVFARIKKYSYQNVTFKFCNLAWLELWERQTEVNEVPKGEDLDTRTFRYTLWAAVKAERNLRGKTMPWTPEEVGEWLLDMPARMTTDIARTLTESRIGGEKITDLAAAVETTEAEDKKKAD